MGAHILKVGEHFRETAARHKTLLRRVEHIERNHIIAVQLLPGPFARYAEVLPHPGAVSLCKVECRLHATRLQPLADAAPYAPYIVQVEPAQRLHTLMLVGYAAAFVITGIFLGILHRHLCQSLCRGHANAHRHTYPAAHLGGELLSPFFYAVGVEALKVQKRFVDGILIHFRRLGAQRGHDAGRQIGIKHIIARKGHYAATPIEVLQLKPRRAHLHPHGFALCRTCHHTPVVVAQHHKRRMKQVRAEHAFA